jgi:hypothetical protein
MKNATLFIVCLVALMAFSQCKSSITVKDLQPPAAALGPKLPRLIPVQDIYPVPASPFLVTVQPQLDSATRQPILLPPVLESPEARPIRTTYFQDANADELQVYFAKDVERNLSSSTGPAKGYISCRINALEMPATNMGLVLFHSFTCGLLTLTGMPFNSARSSIEIEVVIRNNQQQPVKRYWGVADTKKYSGLYYGYRVFEIQRACTLAAFKTALNSVKQQMMNDQELIESLLR